jgi:hypoxanthine-guanine phosphoribosyltransferase
MVDGSDVLIAVGAVRKGATLNWLDTVIGNLGAKSIRYATLLHVNGEGVEPEELTRSRAYVGFTVNRMSDFEHYVGRGLGYRGGARNYPDIHAFDRRELNVVKAQQ